MNTRSLWLMIFCLLFALCAGAQQNRITLKASSQPISFLLNELNRTYGLQFAYSTSQVNLDKRVSVDIRNLEPEQALRKLFQETGIGFTITGNNVVLYASANYNITISGYLREKGTGELLIGAVVSTFPLMAGCVTNAYGFYSITLPADTYTLSYQYTGYKSTAVTINSLQSQQINSELEPATTLNEVVISSKAENQSFKLNSIEVPLLEIKNVPMMLGEKDVVKYIMLSPGVQKGNEGNSYMYVRGGGPDQNLILIDDAVIYNAYHFLGLSSLFSGNELRRAELIKGGFSAKYGGRLSSVLDMSMKDGNREKMSADATIGVISSRLMIEGPILKKKASFLISARKSYLDKVSNFIAEKNDKDNALNYSYYDLHAKLSADFGRKDRVMLSGYLGKDIFATNSDPDITDYEDGISWGNRAASLRWNHEFNGKLFLNTSAVYSSYGSRTAFATMYSPGYVSSNSIEATIRDYTLKTDLDYILDTKHKFKAGGGFTRHLFTQKTVLNQIIMDTTSIKRDKRPEANEWYAYGEWTWTPAQRIKIVAGARYSFYRNTVSYKRIEPRLNLGYNTPTNWHFLASYALMNQYMHLLSTFSGLGLPNDVWVSSDENLAPQRSHLITLGVSKTNLFKRNITVNLEVYHKNIENAVSFREGKSFFNILYMFPGSNIDNWTQLTTQGRGWSDGAELLIKKEHKRFDAWVSYTISKTTFQFNDINRGRSFSPSFDRTHDIGAFVSYKASGHFKFSAYWVYGTGNAITLPVGQYYVFVHSQGSGLTYQQQTSDFEQKNSFRMRSYHRLDLSIQYTHTISKLIQSTIELSIYNAYNRDNPFYYEPEQKPGPNGKRVFQQVSLFPVIPALSWSIKF